MRILWTSFVPAFRRCPSATCSSLSLLPFSYVQLPFKRPVGPAAGLDLLEQERRWDYIQQGRGHEYHGIAVHPRHLSLFERGVLGLHRQYNPQLDAEAKRVEAEEKASKRMEVSISCVCIARTSSLHGVIPAAYYRCICTAVAATVCHHDVHLLVPYHILSCSASVCTFVCPSIYLSFMQSNALFATLFTARLPVCTISNSPPEGSVHDPCSNVLLTQGLIFCKLTQILPGKPLAG